MWLQQALNLETKRPLAHLTVPGAIGSPLSAASSSHSAASPPSAAADSGGAPGNATALSETLIKPGELSIFNVYCFYGFLYLTCFRMLINADFRRAAKGKEYNISSRKCTFIFINPISF